jgi:hypothetical protein
MIHHHAREVRRSGPKAVWQILQPNHEFSNLADRRVPATP